MDDRHMIGENCRCFQHVSSCRYSYTIGNRHIYTLCNRTCSKHNTDLDVRLEHFMPCTESIEPAACTFVSIVALICVHLYNNVVPEKRAARPRDNLSVCISSLYKSHNRSKMFRLRIHFPMYPFTVISAIIIFVKPRLYPA